MSDVMEHYQDDGLHEECGVFGMYDFDGHDVARTIYYGLFALQHRGQESCGIAVSDTEGPKGKVLSSKGMGLVNEVFTQEDLDKLKGNRSWSCTIFNSRCEYQRECTAACTELYQGYPCPGT